VNNEKSWAQLGKQGKKNTTIEIEGNVYHKKAGAEH
jgi:hypothetical protein